MTQKELRYFAKLAGLATLIAAILAAIVVAVLSDSREYALVAAAFVIMFDMIAFAVTTLVIILTVARQQARSKQNEKEGATKYD